MKAEIAIVGAGYVGVPLAQVFANAGRSVVLVDVQADRIAQLNRGESYIEDVPSEELKRLVDDGRVSATTDYDVLREVDAILIALPTPLSEQREPDLSIVLSATAEIALRLQKGQLVVLESTTYPGTTRERVKPLLEESGLTAGTDFHLAFSPERVDPGREDWTTQNTPKVVGGLTEECTKRAIELYGSAVEEIVPVSSPEAAELTKLLENIFRSVNIALVNELAQLCDRMNLDVWEIVDAAATKPFGFMRFEPGPGLGGHCLPVDPFYLSWKARQYDFYTEFIELAGKVNANMPYFCRSLISQALNHGAQRSLNGSKVLVLGVSYKANTADSRESPALKLIELLRNAGADVAYHDPHVPELASRGLSSQPLDPGAYDCVAIVTAHSSIDYEKLVDEARLVVDFRNATGRNGRSGRKSLEAVTKIGLVGLGYWGPNLARNFDELAELRWLCDLEPDLRERFAPRYPEARVAGDFDELLNDPELEAVVIATPAVTHYELAKRALEAGKHVLVEKPPAMNAAEAEDLVSTAEATGRVLMPGHLLLYHPAVRTVKALMDTGELGEVLCVYSNRQNLGKIRADENALWSLGVHDLSVILHLLDEEPSETWAHGNSFLTPGVEDIVFCYLRFPSGKIAHMHLSWLDPHKMRKLTVVGKEKMVVFDDMELERKVTIYEKGPWQPTHTYGEWQTRTGDISSPKIPSDEPLRLECRHFLDLVAGEGDPLRAAQDGLAVVRVLEQLQASLVAAPA